MGLRRRLGLAPSRAHQPNEDLPRLTSSSAAASEAAGADRTLDSGGSAATVVGSASTAREE